MGKQITAAFRKANTEATFKQLANMQTNGQHANKWTTCKQMDNMQTFKRLGNAGIAANQPKRESKHPHAACWQEPNRRPTSIEK